MDRLRIDTILPELYQLLMKISQNLRDSGINKLQLELIKIRASQINGCAYCLHLHTKEALQFGEDPARLAVLSAWREAVQWFSKEEQIVLAVTEEITLISVKGLKNETYQAAVDMFGEETTAKIIFAVISINSLNRLAVSQKLQPQKIAN